MTPALETVLEQAKSLTPTERAKLIKILEKSEEMANKKSSAKEDDKEILAGLKKIIDEQEKKPDSSLTESAKIADQIRKKNDRGFTL